MDRKARIGTAIAVGAGAAALGYGALASAAWMRYGKAAPSPLERFLPRPEIAEHHETKVDASVDVAWDAVQAMNLNDSTLVRLIFRARELVMRAAPAEETAPRTFLEEIRSIGWGTLEDRPGRELVFGAVCQPWNGDVIFRAIPAGEFARFNEPGFTKIVWNLEVAPVDDHHSVFRSETLATTTDDESRRKFRRYWSLASPGIRLIRIEMLRVVRLSARRRSGHATPPGRMEPSRTSQTR